MRHRLGARSVGFTLLLWGALPALADTLYVRASGNDQADGRSPQTAFRTVLRAAQVMNHGDSVVIGPGTYLESVFIAERFGTEQARVTLLGDEAGKSTGDAPGPVTIQPLTTGEAALRILRSKHVTISGLTLKGPGQGLILEECVDARVERSTFTSLFSAITLRGTLGARVESSIVSGCTFGISIQNATGTRLAHLTVVDSSSTGVLVLTSGKGDIRNCIFTANNSSLVADAVSAPNWSSDRNAIDGPAGPWGAVPSVAHIHEWYSATGMDRHSVHVTPRFVQPASGDFHIDPAVRWGGGLPGMFAGIPLDPPVPLDREGRPFGATSGTVPVGAYDYPAPQTSRGWTRLPISLEGKGPRQSAGIYRLDGTLVHTLLADATGVRDLWWDGMNDLGEPVGKSRFEVRSVVHDIRLVDDGAVGDNGNPSGTYNCDNADRALALPDGGFIVTTIYDEAGMTLRRYSASGQPTYASALTEGNFWGLAWWGGEVIGGLGRGPGSKIVRLALPGERVAMLSGEESYSVFSPGQVGEVPSDPTGLAVVRGVAYVALPGPGVIRGIDLRTGKRCGEWPVPGVRDLSADDKGVLWAIAAQDVVSIDAAGRLERRYPTELDHPEFLASGGGRVAAVDRQNSRISILAASDGSILKTLGKDRRTAGSWLPAAWDLFRDPRGAVFFPDGKLLVTEASRVRAFWPDSGRIAYECLSNFMESAVVHPTHPEYVICGLGVFEVDPGTGAWQWRVETPPLGSFKNEKDRSQLLGSPSHAVILEGRPFLAYFNPPKGLTLVDVSDPLKPRVAMHLPSQANLLNPWSYATLAFGRAGDIFAWVDPSLKFRKIPFRGLDAEHNPVYDLAQSQLLGRGQDEGSRGMKPVGALSCDTGTDELYFLAVTSRHHKMVPAWGADGTGVGKCAADGTPRWFSLSSGGNYMSISTVNDGRNSWTLAAKSFGGQIDVFDADGLRLTTGNWSWPSHYTIGFVDLRFGVHGYVRPDGRVGAYVEDDAIGRFARARMEGAQTFVRDRRPLDWSPPEGEITGAARESETRGRKPLIIPRVPALPLDGDWKAWHEAGVDPQIVLLPTSVGFRRAMPSDLVQTFRAGTAIGAIAHDGGNFYVYFLVADDTPRFDAEHSGDLWKFDSIELWLEEEQFGLGLLKGGSAALHKYRHHDRAGTEWKANYALASENVWGRTMGDLSRHPLGERLSSLTGVSFGGKPGYALMARIPFAEVKLVGGVAGREGGVAGMRGSPGEVVRVSVSLDELSTWGRYQDFQVTWPSGSMFSDPTRSYPLSLGEGRP
jgi:hypothetical protein